MAYRNLTPNNSHPTVTTLRLMMVSGRSCKDSNLDRPGRHPDGSGRRPDGSGRLRTAFSRTRFMQVVHTYLLSPDRIIVSKQHSTIRCRWDCHWTFSEVYTLFPSTTLLTFLRKTATSKFLHNTSLPFSIIFVYRREMPDTRINSVKNYGEIIFVLSRNLITIQITSPN